MKPRSVVSYLLFAIAFVLIGYQQFISNNPYEKMVSQIINQQGYKVNMKAKQVTVEVFIKPEWIVLEPNTRENFKTKLHELNSTVMNY